MTIPVVGVACFSLAGDGILELFAIYPDYSGAGWQFAGTGTFLQAVNLHPLVIILSVVIFSAVCGVSGVFFAIPLATLVKAVVHARPDGQGDESTSS